MEVAQVEYVSQMNHKGIINGSPVDDYYRLLTVSDLLQAAVTSKTNLPPANVGNLSKLGPLALLEDALRDKAPIVVSCRNNHKLVGRVLAYDHHCNMILQGVKDLWNETKRDGKGNIISTMPRERYIHKMFLRGDGVIIVVRA